MPVQYSLTEYGCLTTWIAMYCVPGQRQFSLEPPTTLRGSSLNGRDAMRRFLLSGQEQSTQIVVRQRSYDKSCEGSCDGPAGANILPGLYRGDIPKDLPKSWSRRTQEARKYPAMICADSILPHAHPPSSRVVQRPEPFRGSYPSRAGERSFPIYADSYFLDCSSPGNFPRWKLSRDTFTWVKLQPRGRPRDDGWH